MQLKEQIKQQEEGQISVLLVQTKELKVENLLSSNIFVDCDSNQVT